MQAMTRAEYEAAAAKLGVATLPMGDWAERDVWPRWSASAAAGSAQEKSLHAARQQGWFNEQRAGAPAVKTQPVAAGAADMDVIRCKKCGQTNLNGAIFSTLKNSGICDDCV